MTLINIHILVLCLTIAFAAAIRVDWNTNKGPIVPYTPTTTVRPAQPYREPAPVWEDQSDDIPNPNPYVYVLPPPSRPRPAENNYLTRDGNTGNSGQNGNPYKYGKVLTPNDAYAYNQNNGKPGPNVVNYLSAKYIPNVGFRYYAVVPWNHYPKGNLEENYMTKKTKKHKVYEKSRTFAPFSDKERQSQSQKQQQQQQQQYLKALPQQS